TYALNATTGAHIWSNPTGAADSSPCVVNGVVYIGVYSNSAYDSIYALNATNGNKIWIYHIGNPISSSPAVVNGVVYVGGGENIYALNAATGDQIWNVSIHSS